ncbi:hypothetical protein GCM10008955_19130 [Deinococcus malanensis]|uniref:DUF2239 family protein n=1 Tax=Deinococcus malanensis TaxID=1706855 RepID=A0ABQ2EWU3_9DEIO|nr:DUF2239 family protein [Deinococcus malanensis]GGK25615.1 hypothetical protein GCM10008955_19130 [Deinococcus malanensis]
MDENETYTAFRGNRRVGNGSLRELLTQLWKLSPDPHASLLVFSDQTGRSVDLSLHGSLAEMLEREAPLPARPGPGRPRLGVVAREVTLLPRHWEWLESQPAGVSAALRRLVDEARRAAPAAERMRLSRTRADRFLMVMAGDLPGAEEASRALYAGDEPKFKTILNSWPEDIRQHTQRLAADAFPESSQ